MRQQLLAQIRELEAEYGRPPGARLFELETGVAMHQWRGRYWAKWSDALREAGLEPNERQAKADPDLLLEQLAIAARRLGHCPGADELSLYRRTWPAPTPRTVRNHFGPKAALLDRLKRWAASRPDYADVAALIPEDAIEGARRPPAQGEGVVRLFRCRDQYRFARSGGADGLDRSPLVWVPKSSMLEHEIHTDDPAGVEAYWSRRFAYRRLNSEWYALTAEDVAAFKRWKQI